MFIRIHFIAAFLTFAASAQTVALRDPQLDALVAEALKNAPETAAAQANVEAAQRRIVPAHAR